MIQYYNNMYFLLSFLNKPFRKLNLSRVCSVTSWESWDIHIFLASWKFFCSRMSFRHVPKPVAIQPSPQRSTRVASNVRTHIHNDDVNSSWFKIIILINNWSMNGFALVFWVVLRSKQTDSVHEYWALTTQGNIIKLLNCKLYQW